MHAREHDIEELLSDFQAIRRTLGLGQTGSSVTAAQWPVMALLFHQKNMTVKDIAQKLGISSSAATQLLDSLVRNGYITRTESAEDRRKAVLALSKQASAQIARLRDKHVQRLLSVFACLDDAEFEQYAALNKKLAQSVIK